MLRRPSGSPVDEGPDEYFFDGHRNSKEAGNNLRNNLQVKVADDGEWSRKAKSPDRSPRTRTSPGSDKSRSTENAQIDTTLLLGDGKRRNSVDEKSAARLAMRSPWTCSPLTLFTTVLALLTVWAIFHSSMNLQQDPQGCLMSMMTPTYIKLSGFDTEHSRFATKYSLYLYREEGVDEYAPGNIGLRGAPVLFIPGNAGSYKQVRSLSSEAARYYHGYLKHDEQASDSGVGSLDFFTLDFNEDLSAFHGQTIIDQAEYVNEAVAYILSLYHDAEKTMRDAKLPDPSSVILIGHSMGGIVARTVLVTPNYQSNSVNTIITMSTPHARPPVSFDADMVHLYQQINDYWRASYLEKWASNNPLWHTTLISIAGGGRDTTVPSDYTSVSSLVPESHGFTVYTSSIPHVWTSMDHLAITWADQIRKVIVKSLFEAIDVRRPAQTKARADRIKIFRKWFLTGLENDAPKKMPKAELTVLLALEGGSKSPITTFNNITIRSLGAQDKPSARLLQLPLGEMSNQKFVLLTDQRMDEFGGFERIEVLFCSAFPLPAKHASAVLPVQIDLTGGNPGATRLGCKRASGDAIPLPASVRTSKYAFEQQSPFTFLQYRLEQLKDHQLVAIVDKSTEMSDGWVLAEITDDDDSTLKADVNLARLLTRGLHLELPSARPIVTDIRIPTLHSSLLAYKLRIRGQSCDNEKELFTPLLRQHIEAPYESKYFVNFKQGDINLHGVAPFMPPSLQDNEDVTGVGFQIWSDPTCDSSLEFQLEADVPGSLGKLVIRYRTMFAAFPLLVVAMVLRKQFRVYDVTGVFITFSESLNQSLKLALPVLLLSMTFFATAATVASSSGSNPHTLPHLNATINYNQNDLLLGSRETFFWFLVPLAGLISIGTCVTLNYTVLLLLHVFTWLLSLSRRRNHLSNTYSRSSHSSLLVSRSPRRRAINTLILLFLVATIIPYPFAYVVACIVQLATCTRALWSAKMSKTAEQHNFFNYTYSILMLMLWVLPINLPVLVVWVHNLAVHWLTPFTSHHNVLSIMPFILLVETLTSGMMVPRIITKVRWATNMLFFVLAIYAAVYGMSYAYRLHHITNIVALWLVILHFSHNPGFSFGGIKTMLENDVDVETDVKKTP